MGEFLTVGKGKSGTKKLAYNAEGKAAVAEYREKTLVNLGPLKFKKAGKDGKGRIIIRPDYEDAILARATTLKTTGTAHSAIAELLLDQAAMSSCFSTEEAERMSNAVAAAMLDIGPRDALEGLLVAQMVSIHNQAMECFRRANIDEQPLEFATSCRNQAVKLLRTYVSQLEALNKYRRGGQQTVRVEHVSVHQGGQAIVGHIRGGRGES
jgi:hypothetical protein